MGDAVVVLRENMICADRHVGSCKVHKCMQSPLSEELSFEVNFLRGWGGSGASMRKELYYYIPGGTPDDVYSILNVTY